MLSPFRSRSLQLLNSLAHTRRYSTALDIIPAPVATEKAAGALRPHLNIPVNPNHGLWSFFRKKEKDGEITYETLEDSDGLQKSLGRSWTAAELRRKSFRDIHTLWYVLLRERNLLATQSEDFRRMGGLRTALSPSNGRRELQCRKSMARIKYVINERRLAYEGAVNTFAEKKAAAVQAEIRTRRRKILAERAARKAARQAARQALEEEKNVIELVPEVEVQNEPPARKATSAVQFALEGLLRPGPSRDLGSR